MCLGRACSNIFFICRTVEDPSRINLKENVMTYNIQKNGLSLVMGRLLSLQNCLEQDANFS